MMIIITIPLIMLMIVITLEVSNIASESCARGYTTGHDEEHALNLTCSTRYCRNNLWLTFHA